MRRTRVFLGAAAVVAALCLIPSSAGAAGIPTVSACSASSTLQIGLLNSIIIPARPACTTPVLACPFGACTYTTTAVVTNVLSVSSGVVAATVGRDANGTPHLGTAQCGGFQTCTAVSTTTVGAPTSSAPGAGAAGICTWGLGTVQVALGMKITCVLRMTNLVTAPPSTS